MEFLQRHLPRVYQAVQNALEYLSTVTAQIFGPPANAPHPSHPRSNVALGVEASESPEISESSPSATVGTQCQSRSPSLQFQGEGRSILSEEAVEATEGGLGPNEPSPAEDHPMKCGGPTGKPQHENQETDLRNRKSKNRTRSDLEYSVINEDEVLMRDLNILTEKDRAAGALEHPDPSKHLSACEEGLLGDLEHVCLEESNIIIEKSGDQESTTETFTYGMMDDLEHPDIEHVCKEESTIIMENSGDQETRTEECKYNMIGVLEHPDTSGHQDNSACEEGLIGDLEHVCIEESNIIIEKSGDQESTTETFTYGMMDDLEHPDKSNHQENSAHERLMDDIEHVCKEESTIIIENSGDQETRTEECKYSMIGAVEHPDTSGHQDNSACEEGFMGDLEHVCKEDWSILKENSGDHETSPQKCRYETMADLEHPDISKHQENSTHEGLMDDIEYVCKEDLNIITENSGDQETRAEECKYSMIGALEHPGTSGHQDNAACDESLKGDEHVCIEDSGDDETSTQKCQYEMMGDLEQIDTEKSNVSRNQPFNSKEENEAWLGYEGHEHSVCEGKTLSWGCITTEERVLHPSDVQSRTTIDEELPKKTIWENQLQENVLAPESCTNTSLSEGYTEVTLRPEDNPDPEVTNLGAQSGSGELASKVIILDDDVEEGWNLMNISRVDKRIAQNEGDHYLAGQSEDREDISQPERMEDVNQCEILPVVQSTQMQEDIEKNEWSFSLEEIPSRPQEGLIDIPPVDVGEDEPLGDISLEGDLIPSGSRSPILSTLESESSRESVLLTEDNQSFIILDKLEESQCLEMDAQGSKEGVDDLLIKGGQPQSHIFEKDKTLEIMEHGDEKHEGFHEESDSSSRRDDLERGPCVPMSPGGSMRKTDLTPVLSSTTETDQDKYEELLPAEEFAVDSPHSWTYTESLMPPPDQPPNKTEEEDHEASPRHEALIMQDERGYGGFERTVWYDECERIDIKLEELCESDPPCQVGVSDGIQKEAETLSAREGSGIELSLESGEGSHEGETLNNQDRKTEDKVENEEGTNDERSFVIIPGKMSLSEEIENVSETDVNLALESLPLAEDMCLGTSDSTEDQWTQSRTDDFSAEEIRYLSESGFVPDVHHSTPSGLELPDDGEKGTLDEVKGDCRESLTEEVEKEHHLTLTTDEDTERTEGYSYNEEQVTESRDFNTYGDSSKMQNEAGATERLGCENVLPPQSEAAEEIESLEPAIARDTDNNKEELSGEMNWGEKVETSIETSIPEKPTRTPSPVETHEMCRDTDMFHHDDNARLKLESECVGDQDQADRGEESCGEGDGFLAENVLTESCLIQDILEIPVRDSAAINDDLLDVDIHGTEEHKDVSSDDPDLPDHDIFQSKEDSRELSDPSLQTQTQKQNYQQEELEGSSHFPTEEDKMSPASNQGDGLEEADISAEQVVEKEINLVTDTKSVLSDHTVIVDVSLEALNVSLEDASVIEPNHSMVEISDSYKEVDLIPAIDSLSSFEIPKRYVFGNIEEPDFQREAQSITQPDSPTADPLGKVTDLSRMVAPTPGEISPETDSNIRASPEIILTSDDYGSDSRAGSQTIENLEEIIEETDLMKKVRSSAQPSGSGEVHPPAEDIPTPDQLGNEADFSSMVELTPEEVSPGTDSNISASPEIVISDNDGSEIRPASQTIHNLGEAKEENEEEKHNEESPDKRVTSGLSGFELKVTQANEELLQSSPLTSRGDASEDQRQDPRSPEDQLYPKVYEDLTPLEDEDEADVNLFPHSALDLSAQKSRVQLRRKTSIRRRQGLRQSLPDPPADVPPAVAPRPFSVGLPGILGKPPVTVPLPHQVVPTHTDEPKEERGAVEELAVKPKKVIPKHAGFGIPHPQMMQELQARLHKKKPKE